MADRIKISPSSILVANIATRPGIELLSLPGVVLPTLKEAFSYSFKNNLTYVYNVLYY